MPPVALRPQRGFWACGGEMEGSYSSLAGQQRALLLPVYIFSNSARQCTMAGQVVSGVQKSGDQQAQ